MPGTSTALTELLAAGKRLGGLALDLLADRLALLGMEAREIKIRLVQALLLACFGVALLLLGLAMTIVVIMLATPPEWRLTVAAVCTTVCLLAGAMILFVLRRRMARIPLAFSQTIEEIKKDRECF
jgi:uncharacterized membrane protein YqjE